MRPMPPYSAVQNHPGDVPVNTVAPTISGSAPVGSTLTSTTGTWTGALSHLYRWTRNGVVIGGATASTYVMVGADAGRAIRSQVAGVNGDGTSAYVSSSNSVTATAEPSTIAVGNSSYTGDGVVMTTADLTNWIRYNAVSVGYHINSLINRTLYRSPYWFSGQQAYDVSHKGMYRGGADGALSYLADFPGSDGIGLLADSGSEFFAQKMTPLSANEYYTGANGSSWTQRFLQTAGLDDIAISHVEWGGTEWLVCGTIAAAEVIAQVSADYLTVTEHAVTGFPQNFCAKFGSLYIAGCSDGVADSLIRSSADLVTWTTRKTYAGGFFSYGFAKYAIGNGVMIVLSPTGTGRIDRSANGTSWTTVTTFLYGPYTDISYNPTLSKWVLTGGRHTVEGVSDCASYAVSADDGATWTEYDLSGVDASEVLLLDNVASK